MCNTTGGSIAGALPDIMPEFMRKGPVVVIAMDSFKGSIPSLEAAAVVAAGIRSVLPDAEIRCLPVADGGEGTIEAIASGVGGKRITCRVAGPDGTPIDAG